jgi:hypothetical protein
MHILLVGGNGQTGSLVIEEAIQRSPCFQISNVNYNGLPDNVRAYNYSSHPGSKLAQSARGVNNRQRYLPQAKISYSLSKKAKLTIIKITGTPLQQSDIETAFTATFPSVPSAVIVTLASNRTSGSPWAPIASPPRLMADSHANLIAVMRAHSVRKIITMSAFGVGASLPNMTFLMRLVIAYSNLQFAYDDHNQVDQEMKDPARKDIDYVLVRPTRLTGGPKAPLRFYADEGVGLGVLQGVSRASVAGFLVDAVEGATWDRSTPVIAN